MVTTVDKKRRNILKMGSALGVSYALPSLASGATLEDVIIVGAGSAGLYTAYFLNSRFPGRYAVRIFEAGNCAGGNVLTQSVKIGDKPYAIDTGAQFFNDQWVHLLALIDELGLREQVKRYESGMSIFDLAAHNNVLWLPSQLSNLRYLSFHEWKNLLELLLCMTQAAIGLKENKISDNDTLDDWLTTLHAVSAESKQTVLKPYFYPLVSGSLSHVGLASALDAARYLILPFTRPATAMTNGHSISNNTFSTYQIDSGLQSVPLTALERSGANLVLNAPVEAVSFDTSGTYVLSAGKKYYAKHVVLACHPNISAKLLAGYPGAANMVESLQRAGQTYTKIPIAIQLGAPDYIPAQQRRESICINGDYQKDRVCFTADFGFFREPYEQEKRVPVFKSWGAPAIPAKSTHTMFYHEHETPMSTPEFFASIKPFESDYRYKDVVIAGGWSIWKDNISNENQDKCVRSALRAAQAIAGEAIDLRTSAVHYGGLMDFLASVEAHCPALFQEPLSYVKQRLQGLMVHGGLGF